MHFDDFNLFPLFLLQTGNGLLDIRTGVPADEAISAMEFALRKYDSSFDIQIDSTEFNIVAKITSSAGLIEFSARIYKERESADSAFVVRVRKVQVCLLLFLFERPMSDIYHVRVCRVIRLHFEIISIC
jgi:hypothetical protein